MPRTIEQLQPSPQSEETPTLYSSELSYFGEKLTNMLVSRWPEKSEEQYFDEHGNQTDQVHASYAEQHLYKSGNLWAVIRRPVVPAGVSVVTIYAPSSYELEERKNVFDNRRQVYLDETKWREKLLEQEAETDPHAKHMAWVRSLIAQGMYAHQGRITIHKPGLKLH